MRTWLTHIVNECRFCGRPFYPSQEAVADARDVFSDPSLSQQDSDDMIARSFDICLECVEGEPVPGERPEHTILHAR